VKILGMVVLILSLDLDLSKVNSEIWHRYFMKIGKLYFSRNRNVVISAV